MVLLIVLLMVPYLLTGAVVAGLTVRWDSSIGLDGVIGIVFLWPLVVALGVFVGIFYGLSMIVELVAGRSIE